MTPQTPIPDFIVRDMYDNWYFIDIADRQRGPYKSRRTAVKEYNLYISSLETREHRVEARPRKEYRAQL